MYLDKNTQLSRLDDSNVEQNMCNALGISILWRNKLAENGIFQFATTMTDFGLCCNIVLKYDENNNMTKPRSGNIFFSL